MHLLKQIILIVIICYLSTAVIFSQEVNQNQEKVETLLNRLKKAESKKEKVDILNEFIDYLWGSDFDAAKQYTDQALRLAEKNDYEEGIVDAYNNLGFIEFYKSNYEESLDYCKKALRKSYKLGYKKGFVEAYNGIGRHYQVKGNFDNALDKFLVSKNICEQTGNKRELAYCNFGLGAIHFYDEANYYNEARKYFFKSLRLRENINDKNGITSSLYAIGEAFSKESDGKTALQYFQNCLDMSEKIGNRYNMANAYEGIGDIYMMWKDYTKAFYYYKESLKIFDEFNEKFQHAAIHLRIGKYYNEIGENEKALDHLNEAFKKAEEIDVPVLVKNAAKELAKAHPELKQDALAEKYKKIFVEKSNFLKENEIIKLKIFSDLERKEEKERIFWTSLITGTFLSLIALMLFRSYRIKRKSLKSVEKLNEIGKVITSSLSQREIYNMVYKNAKELMDADAFLIFIYDKKSESLVFIGGKEEGVEDSTQFFSLSETYRPAVKCFMEQKPVVFKDYRKEYPGIFGDKPPSPKVGKSFNSHIFLPLTIEGKNGNKKKKIGVVTVQCHKKSAYKTYQVKLLKNIAYYAAIALDNANAYKKIKEANDLKSWLLEIAAHDLKNPLQVIMGFAEQIEKKIKDDASLDQLRKIKISSKQMKRLITELLDNAAIENGEIELKNNIEDVGKLAGYVVQQNQELTNYKDQKIEFETGKNCLIKGDKDRLLEIMENLISNAIKFSPQGKTIWVKVSTNEAKVIFKVRDGGPGLNEKDKTKLFKKFQRLSARPTGGELAIGLGLAITKYFVELHGGSIGGESKPGKGATFIVELPLYEESAVPKAEEIKHRKASTTKNKISRR